MALLNEMLIIMKTKNQFKTEQFKSLKENSTSQLKPLRKALQAMKI